MSLYDAQDVRIDHAQCCLQPGFAGREASHEFRAQLGQYRGQRAVFRPDSLFKAFPQTAGQRRAASPGRNRDAHFSPLEDGRQDESAVRRVIHHVDQAATPDRLGPNRAVYRNVIRGGDCQECAIQVAFPVSAPGVADFSRLGQGLQFGGKDRADDRHLRLSRQQPFHFSGSHSPPANDNSLM